MVDWQDDEPAKPGWQSWAAVGILGATLLLAASIQSKEAQDPSTHRIKLAKAIDAAFSRSPVPYLCAELDRVTRAIAPGEPNDMPAPCSIAHAPSRSAM